jgi:protocatechuate 3,4-dioxygenase alpha subunit
MSAEPKLVPTSSQTVGPFFRIGLEHLIDCPSPSELDALGIITIRGQVLDRDRAPVSDAMLEFWNASYAAAGSNADSAPADFPSGFARAATDAGGNFCVRMSRPAPIPLGNGSAHAPHVLVLVFARGLLRHLISRVYLDDERENGADPVLSTIPVDRRHTLIAQSDGANSFRWNVVLQGDDETVFFAW